jgi:nucleotide-binding universal stress UspA family protein
VTSPDDGATQRIVVGIDGSEPSIRALRWAARQAEQTRAAVEVVMTWEWPTSYGWMLPLPSDYDPAEDARRVLSGAVEAAVADHPSLDISTRVVEGHPAPTLVEVSTGADLLVVGSRGHGEFAGMLLGSVSEHCVAHAECPVVVVRDAR